MVRRRRFSNNRDHADISRSFDSLSAILANKQSFGGGVTLHAILGENRLTYWRCVGLYAIWFAARVRIKFSGPAQITIEGKQ